MHDLNLLAVALPNISEFLLYLKHYYLPILYEIWITIGREAR